jgi:hypothetical protein
MVTDESRSPRDPARAKRATGAERPPLHVVPPAAPEPPPASPRPPMVTVVPLEVIAETLGVVLEEWQRLMLAEIDARIAAAVAEHERGFHGGATEPPT